jgi:hypothetical protein
MLLDLGLIGILEKILIQKDGEKEQLLVLQCINNILVTGFVQISYLLKIDFIWEKLIDFTTY